MAYRGTEKFQALRSQTYQKRIACNPAAFVVPKTTTDVAAIVKCAMKTSLPFRVRNGGHSYEANSLQTDGVTIDLRSLRKLELNKKTGTMVLGGGLLLGPLYKDLAAAGYLVPGGTCPPVGLSGLTLGGGIGHSTRRYSILADNVLSATVVLANGTITNASAEEHPDLFWAIRGGGPFYGIVTEWVFKAHKAPQMVSVVRYRFRNPDAQAYAALLKAYNAWKPWTLSKEHAMVEIQAGFGALKVQFWYHGPMAEANRTMAASPVFKLANIYPVRHQEFRSWMDFILYATNVQDSSTWGADQLEFDRVVNSNAREREAFVAASLLAFQPLSGEASDKLARAMWPQSDQAFIQSRALGGQVTQQSDNFTGFPWRAALFESQVYSKSSDATRDASWVDGILSAMHPYTGPAEYFNYYRCMQDPWKSYFGPHAPRLRAIKGAYDPKKRIAGPECQPQCS